MSQLHGVNGAQQPQATETSASVGRIGPHSVRIGTNPPIRLDAIKGNKIPFAGFRTATKVVSAKTGARENAALVLRSLASPDGGLDAKGLLNAAKSLQTHLDRLGTLGEIRGAMDDAVLAAFAPEVESLSNTELLDAYRQFFSPEMGVLKRALQAEIDANPHNADALAASANLFSLEALVTKEASDRIILAEGLARPDQLPTLSERYGAGIEGMGTAQRHEAPADMSAVSMHVLVDVDIAGSARRKEVEGLVTDMARRRELGNLDAKRFGDVLRSAGLTINVDLGFLLGLNGPKPLLRAGGSWEHIFHSIESAPDEAARQAAIDVKGMGYIQKRDNVERGLFPELSENRPAVANERPTYAAINLLRQRTGAAPTYGFVALHLKPEVARRATYTVDDTFVALRLRYTEHGRQAVRDLLPGFSGVSEAHKLELMREGSELRRNLDATLDGMAAKGTFRADLFKNEFQLPGLEDDENSALAGLFIKIFKDPESTRAAMASFDTLETLLPELGDMDAVSLARAALDRRAAGRVASECNYIEAQVHGPIVFARDVAEIVVNKEFGLDVLTPDQRAWFDAVVAVLGGKQPSAEALAGFSAERKAELAAIREQLGGAVIPVRIAEQMPELHLKHEVKDEESAFYAAHFDQPRIEATLDAVRDDAGLQAFMDKTMEMRGGASLRMLGDRRLITDADAPRVREAFAAYVERYRHAPTDAQRTENELLADCMWRAVSDVAGKDRLDSLAAIETLTENPARRATLRDFVMDHPRMGGRAFRALASAALRGAATLDGLAPEGGEPLTDEALIAGLGEAESALRGSLDALPQEAREAANEGALVRAFGGLALSLMRDASPEASDRVAERLNGPALQGLSGVLLRLGDAERGFPEDAGFRDAQVFNAFLSGLRAALGDKAQAPAAFAGELSLVPQAERDRLRAAVPGLADTLDASFPIRPPFPPAAGGRLDVTPARHRDFLLSMLPIYHDHERPGSFDHGAGYHGRGHISRAFIFASAMAGIMEGMGHTVDRTALLCGIAGHDAGRVNNGADTPEQEAESARLALGKMRERFGADTFGDAYEREFTAAIVGHASPTLESMLLNAADSLDIGRVKDFDFKYFPFLRGGEQEGPKTVVPEYQNLREQLHEEADLLARMTDPLTQTRDLRMKLGEAGDMESMVRVQRAASDAVAGQLALDSEEAFLAFVEGKIRAYPDLFPLLTRYYLKPLEQ